MPSAPVIPEIVPPVASPPTAVLAVVPLTVKLPEVFLRKMPFGPPVVETVFRTTDSGVVLLARLISTPAAPVVVIVPLGMVMVWVLSVASRPRWFASGVMVSAPKVIAPVFVVRLIPVPPEPVTDVAAKLNPRLELPTLMPMPVGFVTVVEPVVKLPATVARLRPVVALLVEERLPNEPLRVPVERFNVLPLPFNVTSETFSVPKPVPVISDVELPPVNPRKVLF